MFKKLVAGFKDLEKGRRGTFGNDISTARTRRQALWHFHLFDHAFLRVWWNNLHEISPGVWRSNQPSPKRIEVAARELGVTTILSLRAPAQLSFHLLEVEACERHGLKFVTVPMSASNAQKKEVYLTLLDVFETLEKPVLFHCKSGADRTGIAAALYLLHIENAPLKIARKQLSARFLHLRGTKTGILDHILDQYDKDLDRIGIIGIREWLENHYDQQQIIADFKPRWNLS